MNVVAVSRDHEDLQRKYSQVQREMETTSRELANRDTQLIQLRKRKYRTPSAVFCLFLLYSAFLHGSLTSEEKY